MVTYIFHALCLQAHQITSQSEQEVLSSEVARKEEAINRYKLKFMGLEDKAEQYANKVSSTDFRFAGEYDKVQSWVCSFTVFKLLQYRGGKSVRVMDPWI